MVLSVKVLYMQMCVNVCLGMIPLHSNYFTPTLRALCWAIWRHRHEKNTRKLSFRELNPVREIRPIVSMRTVSN